MKAEDWDELVMKTARAQGAVNFPSLADLRAKARVELGEKWSAEAEGLWISAYAHGVNKGIEALRDVFRHADATRPRYRYVQAEQKNDITNLWGLIP